MADQDETDDAVDSLTWPDTSRPIISNNLPAQPRHIPPARVGDRDPFLTGPRRNRWPLVVVIVVLLAVAIAVWVLI